MTDQQRTGESGHTKRDPADTRSLPTSRGWILTNYYGPLTNEVSQAFDQLHNATNWGVTLITAGVIAVLSRERFPDSASFYMLLTLLVVSTHFSVRGMKGYINVIRFSFLQRSVTAAALESSSQSTVSREDLLENLVRTYHVDWRLPLTRRDVYLKGALELGFGYMIVIISGLTVFTAVSISFRIGDWLALIGALALVSAEVTRFARSPYMRSPLPDESARQQR